jgi:hypothetical protein
MTLRHFPHTFARLVIPYGLRAQMRPQAHATRTGENHDMRIRLRLWRWWNRNRRRAAAKPAPRPPEKSVEEVEELRRELRRDWEPSYVVDAEEKSAETP